MYSIGVGYLLDLLRDLEASGVIKIVDVDKLRDELASEIESINQDITEEKADY